jgi:hypothetical protein
MARARTAAVLLLVLLVAGACGYRAVTPYRAAGGAERIHVRAFENDSTDPELGAVVTAALREELARRGASADAGAPAQLDGAIRVMVAGPSSFTGSTGALKVEVRGRLWADGRLVQELTVQRADNQLTGADALEAEGRRAVALRRLARDAAHELLRALEAKPGRAPSGAALE